MPGSLRKSVSLPPIAGCGGADRGVSRKQKLMLGLTGAMLGTLLAGCTAAKQPSSGETTLANAAKDVVIPLEAGKKTNPLPDTDDVASQGKAVFLGSCAQCHGADGRGDGDLGRSMSPPAMDLTSAHVQHWSDGELFWIIQNGVHLTGMPSWKSKISDDSTWKLARFIHKLPQLETASASTAATSSAPAAPVSTQDKYTLKVPNGLAFAEFRGYESWPVISISHNGDHMAAILGNPAMIDAYKAGIPGNGKPFPDGAKMAKVHYNLKKLETFPTATVPDTQHDVDFMVKDSKRFADSGGWGYAVFEIDPPSGNFRIGNLGDKPPQGEDAKCGFACHTSVKNRDYVFTEYQRR